MPMKTCLRLSLGRQFKISCNPKGCRRDRCQGLCHIASLTVYGLRCSEVTNMKLKDIDWRNETLYLRRAKNCRPQVLPLLPIVGDAIIRYIKEARFNKSGNEYLFYADVPLMNSFPLRLYTSWSGTS